MTEKIPSQVKQIFLIYLESFVHNSALTLKETQSEKLKKKINLDEAIEATKRFDHKADLLNNEWRKKQEKFDQGMEAKELKIHNLKADMEFLTAAIEGKIHKAM